MNCLGCDLIKEKRNIVFEDDKVMGFLKEKPAIEGHIIVMPKQHFTILEQIPDIDVGHIFEVANRISSSLFEGLNIQGTNIILQNGIAAGQNVSHFMVNVIPRVDNDGLDFQWKTKKLNEEEMSAAEMKLKESAKNRIVEVSDEKPAEIEQKSDVLEPDDILVKHIRRIP